MIINDYNSWKAARIKSAYEFEDTVLQIYGGTKHVYLDCDGDVSVPDIVRRVAGKYEAIECKSISYGHFDSAVYKLRYQVAKRAKLRKKGLEQRIVLEDFGFTDEEKNDIRDYIRSYTDQYYYKIPIDFLKRQT